MKQYHEIVDEVVAAIEDVISTNDVEGQLAKDIVQSAFAEWISFISAWNGSALSIRLKISSP